LCAAALGIHNLPSNSCYVPGHCFFKGNADERKLNPLWVEIKTSVATTPYCFFERTISDFNKKAGGHHTYIYQWLDSEGCLSLLVSQLLEKHY
jgi:hypothetical protein